MTPPPSCFRRGDGPRGCGRSAYKRFARAAHAIRFAMEDVAPELLVGACLEVDERRYGNTDIRRLYESAEYPLTRRAGQS